MTGPLRVLFIEDHADQSLTFAVLLGECGCNVVTAPSGSEGSTLAQEMRPHLVFVDLGLPDMSGIEVAKLLKEKCHPPPLLVALTGYGEKERSAWQDLGLDDYLLKPARFEVVLGILLKAQHWRESMEGPAASTD